MAAAFEVHQVTLRVLQFSFFDSSFSGAMRARLSCARAAVFRGRHGAIRRCGPAHETSGIPDRPLQRIAVRDKLPLGGQRQDVGSGSGWAPQRVANSSPSRKSRLPLHQVQTCSGPDSRTQRFDDGLVKASPASSIASSRRPGLEQIAQNEQLLGRTCGAAEIVEKDARDAGDCAARDAGLK